MWRRTTGSLTFPSIDHAYRTCCYGIIEPTAIYVNKENYKKLCDMVEQQLPNGCYPPMFKFHNALVSPTGIDNNIWFINQNHYGDYDRNCYLIIEE